ncbi:16S rRNA (cytosine(1402)-N(4))-methyltransferase RsmH [Betaproteobacteria bacterium]|nr:16S rRNA (cytosine(1402)-N(4))-methyltransferase RsmH [Betaproteobacteria bacterium]
MNETSSNSRGNNLHQPVFLEEAVDGLNIFSGGTYVDATFGRGGHSMEILSRLGFDGKLIAIDKDPDAIEYAKALNDKRLSLYHGSFSDLSFLLKSLKIKKVNGVLLDLGVSSPQVDSAERGFSFQTTGPLDMRMNTSTGQTVHEWLKGATSLQIEKVLKDFGDEKLSSFIAAELVLRRDNKDCNTSKQFPETTSDLADLVFDVIDGKRKRHYYKTHPATKTFQALRIFINNELEDLKDLLEQIPMIVSHNGRLSVISFHSLEHRLVKFSMRSRKAQCNNYSAHPKRLGFFSDQDTVKFPTCAIKEIKKIKPSRENIQRNPRSRSALLRVGEIICAKQE